jgi:hypothetical protein
LQPYEDDVGLLDEDEEELEPDGDLIGLLDEATPRAALHVK